MSKCKVLVLVLINNFALAFLLKMHSKNFGAKSVGGIDIIKAEISIKRPSSCENGQIIILN